jgi:hypothetical protein
MGFKTGNHADKNINDATKADAERQVFDPQGDACPVPAFDIVCHEK